MRTLRHLLLLTLVAFATGTHAQSRMDYPRAEWSKAGVTVEWIPLESLIDGYGAAHCMTQVLQRETL